MMTAPDCSARMWRGFVRWSLLFLVLLSLPPALYAQDQDRCTQELADAEARYRTGAFDEAITLASACLDQQGLGLEEAVRAYRLISLAYLNKNDVDQARLALIKLFGMQPGYEADPVQDPPAYAALVNLVRQQLQLPLRAEELETQPPPAVVDEPEVVEATLPEQEEKSWIRSRTTWLAIGGGVVLAGLVAVLAGGGSGGGPNALPPPPGLP